MEQKTNIDRRLFSRYVAKKIKHISSTHIESIISILFDEMTQDLEKGITITIGNFGKFILETLGPRKHLNINSGEFTISPGNKILRFCLTKKLRLFLIKNLDIAKTYGDAYNE